MHESGIPFSDASGDRLREWMGVSDETFYDERRVAICRWGCAIPVACQAVATRPASRMRAALA